MRWEIKNILINITNVVLLIIALFLTGRVIFRLLSANPGTPFVSWVYSVSDYFMTPFKGIFNPLSITRNSILDVDALISLAAYALLGFLVIYLIRTLTARITPSEEVYDEDVHEAGDHRHAHTERHAHTH